MKSYTKNLSMFLLLLFTAIVGCNKDDDEVIPRNELVAMAGEDKTIPLKEEVLLDGSASYDRSNKPFTYLWSFKTKPQGSVAVLGNNSSVKTTFTPDVAGLYVIQLTIRQENWSAVDELVITANSSDPNDPTVVILNEDITSNTALADVIEDPSQPDYLVTEDIEVRADLTIMPGVTIVFQENKGLQIVNGSIRAIGTSENSIVFKGLGDRPAYWKGMVIHSNSDLNEFEYVMVKQAGSSPFIESGIKANVTLAGTEISGAALKIRHTVFSESGGYGLYVQGMSSLNHFANNAFYDNASASAYIPAGQLHKIDVVSFSGGGFTGLETGGALLQEGEVAWKKLASGSYLVTSDILIRSGVTINDGASFKMESGVTIRVMDNGYLKASGTESLGITFTSRATNVYWNGLFFNSINQNNRLDNCVISNAGLHKIADADHSANIVVGQNGYVTVENCNIRNGLGYGVVTKAIEKVNQNVTQVNKFENLQSGSVYPVINNTPDKPSVTGIWIDQWTFNKKVNGISQNYYNRETGVWFAGAANPWDMSSAGFGIQFNENGSFIWTVAEHSPMTGCESYSAEYMTGSATISTSKISFNQNYWRSKFINSCDETQNVDTEVTATEIDISYEINQMHDLSTGEAYWELKFTNPDNSTFSFYRRIVSN